MCLTVGRLIKLSNDVLGAACGGKTSLTIKAWIPQDL